MPLSLSENNHVQTDQIASINARRGGIFAVRPLHRRIDFRPCTELLARLIGRRPLAVVPRRATPDTSGAHHLLPKQTRQESPDENPKPPFPPCLNNVLARTPSREGSTSNPITSSVDDGELIPSDIFGQDLSAAARLVDAD